MIIVYLAVAVFLKVIVYFVMYIFLSESDIVCSYELKSTYDGSYLNVNALRTFDHATQTQRSLTGVTINN